VKIVSPELIVSHHVFGVGRRKNFMLYAKENQPNIKFPQTLFSIF
jgi:hypothetical protein